ncbi:MAG: hypothetical protein KA146_02525 [Leptospiraceae bacterium]|jgi:C-methyltransferase|nr:hypothetical protein [Leptospiraceae bacterium]
MKNKIREEIKSKFVSYWESLALSAACKFNLFDLIHDGYNELASLQLKSNTDLLILSKLLNVLIQLGFVSVDNQCYTLTEKGLLLTDVHPESLKQACILWSEEHLTAWQNLDTTLKSGKSSFREVFKQDYFSYINQYPSKLKNYQLAMEEYAREDYQNSSQIYDFTIHKSIMDVGSGTGLLIDSIVRDTGIQGYMFDYVEVLNLTENKTHIHKVSGNFLEHIPSLAEAILLARVLHDWEDEKVKVILRNCYTALPDNGKLYIIEILKELLPDKAALLDLNMSVMCNSSERTVAEYNSLLSQSGFTFIELKEVNSLQYLLVWEKI